MKSDTAEMLEPVAARIVLVDDDLATRSELESQLVAAGFEVRSLPDVATLQATLTEWRPHLLILDEWLPQTTGRETALKLRAQGAFFDIPIIGLLSEASVPQALHWLRSGAVDLWTRGTDFDPAERARDLLDELNESRVHAASLKARLTAWARRRHLSGTVLFYPETPFEGRARFESGELTLVRFGGLEGDAALEELLRIDDAPARWVPGDEVTGRHRVPGGSYRPRVLVVEDDDALRGLLLKQLAPFGDIDGAADGIEGLLKATSTAFDLVVADLNLPGLDGWGLMRQLRQNIVAREAAILVLSAHDELRETLKLARAGARAYLKKTGRAKPLLDTLELLLTPRREAWDSLARKDKTAIDLRLVGPMWTLRAVAELDLVGTIQIEEPLGRFEVKAAHGQLLSATAQTGSLRIEGVMALESFLSSTGEGFFVPGDVGPVPKDAPWLFETAEKAGKALEAWLSARMRDAVSQPGKLFLHPDLSLLFSRVASDKELKVLAALRANPLGVADLSDAVGLPYEDVEHALSELLRRGVLMTEAPVDTSSSASGVHDAPPES
ncbi:MAG: response regulator [Myxococcales bacterium]|nr:response regulator [Myxococcales bacterium]